MGREIRNVPEGWEHPRYSAADAPNPTTVGAYRPQFEQTLVQRVAADPDYADVDPAAFRPENMSGGTHVQLYECTTEGTPISPVFRDVETVTRHLLEHGDDRDRKWSTDAVRHITQHRFMITSEALAYGV